MTIKECQEEHKKLWNWIADETERTGTAVSKQDYFLHYFPDVDFSCFACEYDRQRKDVLLRNIFKIRCRFCPIHWETIIPNYMSGKRSSGSVYEACVEQAYSTAYLKWFDFQTTGLTPEKLSKEDVKLVAGYAREIANYPFLTEEELENLTK